MSRRWDAVAVDAVDDVAVALRDLAVGEAARVRAGDSIETVALRDDVPLGHKFARRDLAAGATVRKYGAPIGAATAAIRAGAHVHIHNMASSRARRVGGGA